MSCPQGHRLRRKESVSPLERVDDDGIESVVWYWSPAHQAGWKNAGLLEAAARMLDEHNTDID